MENHALTSIKEMNLENQIVLGLDVSAGKVDAYIQEKSFTTSVRDLYESAEFDRNHFISPINSGLITRILEINPDCVVLEPTGPYSKYLVAQFEANNIKYLLVNQTLVKETRKGLSGTDNKDDAFDAILMCYCYQMFYIQTFERRYWLEDRPQKIKDIRQILLDIQSTTKKSTAARNSIKQRLARGEWIGKAKIKSSRKDGQLHPDHLPPFYAWLCGWTEESEWELSKQWQNQWDKEYAKALESGEATGISEGTKCHAMSVCLLHQEEARLEQELLGKLADPIFAPYHKVFKEFGFGCRQRAWFLSRIFPFSKFLQDGKPIVDYTMGKQKGDRKHKTKKNRSLRRFRQSLGMGQVQRQSGTSINSRSKPKGSGIARSMLWLFVNSKFEMNMTKTGKLRHDLPNNRVMNTLLAYWLDRAYRKLESGKLEKHSGKELYAARAATMRRVAGLLYSELLKELSD